MSPAWFQGARNLDAIEDATLDPTVFKRLNTDPSKHEKTMVGPYRPANLLRYMAGRPELDDQLNKASLSAVAKVRGDEHAIENH